MASSQAKNQNEAHGQTDKDKKKKDAELQKPELGPVKRTRRPDVDDPVEVASVDSFPASDPPSYSPIHPGGTDTDQRERGKTKKDD